MPQLSLQSLVKDMSDTIIRASNRNTAYQDQEQGQAEWSSSSSFPSIEIEPRGVWASSIDISINQRPAMIHVVVLRIACQVSIFGLLDDCDPPCSAVLLANSSPAASSSFVGILTIIKYKTFWYAASQLRNLHLQIDATHLLEDALDTVRSTSKSGTKNGADKAI